MDPAQRQPLLTELPVGTLGLTRLQIQHQLYLQMESSQREGLWGRLLGLVVAEGRRHRVSVALNIPVELAARRARLIDLVAVEVVLPVAN
jgi:hypothetical protein